MDDEISVIRIFCTAAVNWLKVFLEIVTLTFLCFKKTCFKGQLRASNHIKCQFLHNVILDPAQYANCQKLTTVSASKPQRLNPNSFGDLFSSPAKQMTLASGVMNLVNVCRLALSLSVCLGLVTTSILCVIQSQEDSWNCSSTHPQVQLRMNLVTVAPLSPDSPTNSLTLKLVAWGET